MSAEAPYSSDPRRRASLLELSDEALRRSRDNPAGLHGYASLAALGVAAVFRVALALEHLTDRVEDHLPAGRS